MFKNQFVDREARACRGLGMKGVGDGRNIFPRPRIWTRGHRANYVSTPPFFLPTLLLQVSSQQSPHSLHLKFWWTYLLSSWQQHLVKDYWVDCKHFMHRLTSSPLSLCISSPSFLSPPFSSSPALPPSPALFPSLPLPPSFSFRPHPGGGWWVPRHILIVWKSVCLCAWDRGLRDTRKRFGLTISRDSQTQTLRAGSRVRLPRGMMGARKFAWSYFGSRHPRTASIWKRLMWYHLSSTSSPPLVRAWAARCLSLRLIPCLLFLLHL